MLAWLACGTCRPEARAEVFNEDFGSNLLLLLAPLPVLVLAIGAVCWAAGRMGRLR